MSRDRLTDEEIELLQTEEGAFAVVMGYLKSERGKIAPSVFNKLIAPLGYERQNKEKLTTIAQIIIDDPKLHKLFEKGYLREIKLDDLPDIMNEVGEVKEEDVFAQITNFLIDNEDNNARLRELRKLQREGIYLNILMDNVKKHLLEELQGMPRAKYVKTEVPEASEGDKHLILCFSDTHIGALVYNEDTGGYDFEKLVETTQKIINQTIHTIQTYDIKHLHVYHVGDIIEHISMRNVNQAFESEFPATEQVAKSVRWLTDILMQLSKHTHVTFGIVAGNHDRFDGNKSDKIYNDTVTYIILDSLFMIQEDLGQLPNVTLIDNRTDTYEFTQVVAGKRVKVTHGDTERKQDDVKIPKHIKEDLIDILIMGHIHTTRIVQEDYGRFHVYVGSPMGANNFSKSLNLPTTSPAQMMMVLTEGVKTPVFIPLLDI